MYGKHILAIACSGLLTVGTMGSAIAVEDTSNGYSGDTSESGLTASKTVQNQASSESGDTAKAAVAKGEGTSQDEMKTDQASAEVYTDDATETTSQSKTMAQGGQAQSGATSNATIMAGKEVRNRQGKRLGRVAGVVIDESGRVQAVILGAGGASGSGQNQFTVVPREGLQREVSGPDQAVMRLQHITGWMRQKLAQQELQISVLEQQLARLQADTQSGRGAALGNMNRGRPAVASIQSNPLGRVDKVVVDRFGRVQAIVLESGMVLAPGGTAGAAAGQAQADRYAARQNRPPIQLGGAEQPGQRRRAVIIFNPAQQSGSEFSGFERQAMPAR